MAIISQKAQDMPASAIRKLLPYAEAAKKTGVKVYHLNQGQPDIKSPQCALDAVRNFSQANVSYSHSGGLMDLRKGLVDFPILFFHPRIVELCDQCERGYDHV